MKPGPTPLPAVEHARRGNPSKLHLEDLLEVRPPVEIPAHPTHLLPAAKKEWKRITPLLAELGLIAKIDMAALAVYCQAYGRWHDAERKIQALNKADPVALPGLATETPSGYTQMSVWLQISNRAVDQMHKMLCEFGMSPSARSRVTPSDVQLPLPGFEKPGALADAGEKVKAKVIGFPAL
jgi:P27 family predicted phage terminase small subunit